MKALTVLVVLSLMSTGSYASTHKHKEVPKVEEVRPKDCPNFSHVSSADSKNLTPECQKEYRLYLEG